VDSRNHSTNSINSTQVSPRQPVTTTYDLRHLPRLHRRRRVREWDVAAAAWEQTRPVLWTPL